MISPQEILLLKGAARETTPSPNTLQRAGQHFLHSKEVLLEKLIRDSRNESRTPVQAHGGQEGHYIVKKCHSRVDSTWCSN